MHTDQAKLLRAAAAAIHSLRVSLRIDRRRLAALFLTVALACRGAVAQEEFSAWNLETSIGQAHLILVARVATISRLTIVEGAKTDLAFREYRFQPVLRLKGLFQRDQLSMTAADLGCPAEHAESDCPLKEGEYRLLILVQRQGIGNYGCVAAAPGATTLAERVPLLTGPDDPLVGVVETLIQVADSRSRRERAKLLVDRLATAEGLAAVPLLTSLQLRADWGATDPRALEALSRLAGSTSAVVRGGALAVLRELLATGSVPQEPQSLDRVAATLQTVLESDEAVTRIRLSALEALGDLLAQNSDFDWARALLVGQLNSAATNAERAAAATALAHVAHPQATEALLGALARLPLDATPSLKSLYANAALTADAAAEKVLLTRLERSMAARQSLEGELQPFCRLHSEASLPLLLRAAAAPNLPLAEGKLIATALGNLRDDRGVPVLVGWLRTDVTGIKPFALSALEAIDSPLAAREARSSLKSEAFLPFKLRIARLLARHGYSDGYALATEHLADEGQMAAAALVLGALDDPRTKDDLSAIVAARPDRRWYAAALVGLAAIDDAEAEREILGILAADRNPLAADAAEAAGLTTNPELLLPLTTLVRSRNVQIATASLVALRWYLTDVRSSPLGLAAANGKDDDRDEPAEPARNLASLSADTQKALATAVAALALDAYVDPRIRLQALAVANLLRGDGYAGVLSELADQAELEGTQLMKAVQQHRRKSI